MEERRASGRSGVPLAGAVVCITLLSLIGILTWGRRRRRAARRSTPSLGARPVQLAHGSPLPSRPRAGPALEQCAGVIRSSMPPLLFLSFI
jgi:hypothetical protein